MSQSQKRLWLILCLVLVSLVIAMPKEISFKSIHLIRPDLNLKIGSIHFSRSLDAKLGLDLAGGTQVTLLADMSQVKADDREDALTSAKEVIARRVDLFGVSEPNIFSQQAGDSYQIIVELPGLENPDQALSLIGQTAQLSFLSPIYQEATNSGEPQLVDFAPTDLTGADLKRASVDFNKTTGNPEVAIEFNPDGTKKFANLTKQYLNKRLGIALDNQFITAPTVQSEITTGQAVITGDYTQEAANLLATQLNAGALPVPIKVVSQNTITPTLGQSSITQSIRAALIGLGLVVAFMSLYYGYLGIIASVGLAIYGLLTLTIYKLLPVTLTLPGIAGFALSVGMAVDSNILIFERLKEELRSGRSWQTALELGFGRAWDSIKDANITTLITSFILFNPLNWPFLPTSGLVRGFALTLALGILISLFTGIYVTRTLLRLFYRGQEKLLITEH